MTNHSVLHKRKNNLIKKATYHELVFKDKLDSAGIKYTFQKMFIRDYYKCIVDFYIHKPYKICIEIDGEYHSNIDVKHKDAIKDNFLIKNNYKIIRIKTMK